MQLDLSDFQFYCRYAACQKSNKHKCHSVMFSFLRHCCILLISFSKHSWIYSAGNLVLFLWLDRGVKSLCQTPSCETVPFYPFFGEISGTRRSSCPVFVPVCPVGPTSQLERRFVLQICRHCFSHKNLQTFFLLRTAVQLLAGFFSLKQQQQQQQAS